MMVFMSLLAVAASTELTMTDPSILYSPYNWVVANGTAKTINSGAYFRVVFSGATCVLHTDTSSATLAQPFSQFWARVDGGPLQQFVLAPGSPSFNVSLGPDYATTHSVTHHFLEVIVKSTTETRSRWAPQDTAVIFSGITLDDGATARAPRRRQHNVLIYGDSITEGVRTLGWVGVQNDTDRNDAVRDYSFQVGSMLDAEFGIVAFGASGLTHAGTGGVPPLGGSWNQLWAGAPRDFATHAPDLIIYNEGTNDGTSNITGLMLDVVRRVQAAAPHTKQLLLAPFDGQQAANLQAH